MARGITVEDPRWLKFEEFLADMGEKPPNMSLGRIDNDKGYCLANCRWETVQQQARNKRSNRILELDGVRRPVVEWAEHLGIPEQTIHNRLYLEWPTEKILGQSIRYRPKLK